MNIFNPFFLFWNFFKRFSFGIKINIIYLCVCIVLILGCWWLYQRFNTIPVFKNEIELYEYISKDINPKIWFISNINFGIYKHSDVPKLNGLMYRQDTTHIKTVTPIFTDYLISEAQNNIRVRDLEKIGEGVMNEKYISLYDTLTKLVDTFDINRAVYAVDLKFKQVYPKEIELPLPKSQTIDTYNQYTRLFESEFGEDYITDQRTIESRIVKIETDQSSRYKSFMFFNGMDYGNSFSNSFLSIFNLYDISQAYVVFKYKGNAKLDHLRFNFGSAVVCTGLNPNIAEINMDNIIIKDSVFLSSTTYMYKPINDFELRFHVSPKDTQNLQTMRLFVLTTLFSLLLTFFLSCVVKIIKVKVHRFIPRLRDNADGKLWSVYDSWLGDYSKFQCHKNYETKEICEFYISLCNRYYKKHFIASLFPKKKTKKSKAKKN